MISPRRAEAILERYYARVRRLAAPSNTNVRDLALANRLRYQHAVFIHKYIRSRFVPR